jgi:hypothetical protein
VKAITLSRVLPFWLARIQNTPRPAVADTSGTDGPWLTDHNEGSVILYPKVLPSRVGSIRRGWGSFEILLQFTPCSDASFFIDLNVDQIGATADRTIFNVFLTRALRDVKRDHDLLAAGIADVTCFVVHARFFLSWPFTVTQLVKVAAMKPQPFHWV